MLTWSGTSKPYPLPPVCRMILSMLGAMALMERTAVRSMSVLTLFRDSKSSVWMYALDWLD